jgi:hypothetical protein
MVEKIRIQRLAKLCVFVAIANLPFVTIAQLIGIDTFIDSFQHPDSYLYIKNDRKDVPGLEGGYTILERPTNQDYAIEKGDTILYYTASDVMQQRIVYQILIQQGMKTYYTAAINEERFDGPIYDQQIIGKIKGTIDDNIWNVLCLQIWDLSIEKLNAVTLFSNK